MEPLGLRVPWHRLSIVRSSLGIDHAEEAAAEEFGNGGHTIGRVVEGPVKVLLSTFEGPLLLLMLRDAPLLRRAQGAFVVMIPEAGEVVRVLAVEMDGRHVEGSEASRAFGLLEDAPC